MYKLQLVIKLDAIFNINHYHYIYELITLLFFVDWFKFERLC